MRLTRLYRPSVWNLSPFERMNSLRDEINRLFESPWGELGRPGESFNEWVPALDLREDKDNLIATVEIPGMKKEDLDVSVHEGTLSVSGERTCEAKSEESGSYRCERQFGRFHRAVTLPKPVKADGIKASYRDGILTVTLPKTEEAKPKQIEVKVG